MLKTLTGAEKDGLSRGPSTCARSSRAHSLNVKAGRDERCLSQDSVAFKRLHKTEDREKPI